MGVENQQQTNFPKRESQFDEREMDVCMDGWMDGWMMMGGTHSTETKTMSWMD